MVGPMSHGSYFRPIFQSGRTTRSNCPLPIQSTKPRIDRIGPARITRLTSGQPATPHPAMETAAATPIQAPHVLVVPFTAQGHTLPLLDFAALLAARGLRLTVVTTPANLPLLSPLLAAHPEAVHCHMDGGVTP